MIPAHPSSSPDVSAAPPTPDEQLRQGTVPAWPAQDLSKRYPPLLEQLDRQLFSPPCSFEMVLDAVIAVIASSPRRGASATEAPEAR
jgi:hypothetical protein